MKFKQFKKIFDKSYEIGDLIQTTYGMFYLLTKDFEEKSVLMSNKEGFATIHYKNIILPLATMKSFMGDLPINVIRCYPVYEYISEPRVINGCLTLSSYDPYWNKREVLEKLYSESPLVELIPILSDIKATDTLYAQMKTKLKELKEESSTCEISSNVGLDTIYITPNPKTKEYRAILPKGFIFIDAIGNEDYAHVTYRISDTKKSVKLKKVGKGRVSINPETGVIKMS